MVVIERGNRKLQCSIAFAVSLASVTAGMSMSWSTPVIAKFHDNEIDIQITNSEISWMAAMVSPGYIVGSLSTGFTSDRFGRRLTILGSALPIAIGMIFITISVQAWILYIGRFLWGCGAGITGTVSIMYLTEVVDKDIRGSLSIVIRFMFNFGGFLIMAIGPFVSFDVLNYMLIVLPVLYFIGCWFIPESPYYYLRDGQVGNARRELLKLSGSKDSKVLEDKLTVMRLNVNKEMIRSGSLKELFTGKQYRKAVIITVGLRLTQIMSGTFAIQNYLGRIIQESNSEFTLTSALIIFGAVKFSVGIMSSMLVDRLGRRPLLIYSYFGTTIMLIMIGCFFFSQRAKGTDSSSGVNGYMPFIGIIFATVISGMGYDSIVYVVPAEIFTINVKSVAMTFSNILGGLLNFGAVKTYQQLRDFTGLHGVFWFYATISFIGAIFSYFVVPETKGKSLREIQIQLQGNIYVENDERVNEVGCGEVNDNNETELQEIRKNES